MYDYIYMEFFFLSDSFSCFNIMSWTTLFFLRFPKPRDILLAPWILQLADNPPQTVKMESKNAPRVMGGLGVGHAVNGAVQPPVRRFWAGILKTGLPAPAASSNNNIYKQPIFWSSWPADTIVMSISTLIVNFQIRNI